MDIQWRLLWHNKKIIGYTNSEQDAIELCLKYKNIKWTVPRKKYPSDYSKHNNKNHILTLYTNPNESEV